MILNTVIVNARWCDCSLLKTSFGASNRVRMNKTLYGWRAVTGVSFFLDRFLFHSSVLRFNSLPLAQIKWIYQDFFSVNWSPSLAFDARRNNRCVHCLSKFSFALYDKHKICKSFCHGDHPLWLCFPTNHCLQRLQINSLHPRNFFPLSKEHKGREGFYIDEDI